MSSTIIGKRGCRAAIAGSHPSGRHTHETIRSIRQRGPRPSGRRPRRGADGRRHTGARLTHGGPTSHLRGGSHLAANASERLDLGRYPRTVCRRCSRSTRETECIRARRATADGSSGGSSRGPDPLRASSLRYPLRRSASAPRTARSTCSMVLYRCGHSRSPPVAAPAMPWC